MVGLSYYEQINNEYLDGDNNLKAIENFSFVLILSPVFGFLAFSFLLIFFSLYLLLEYTNKIIYESSLFLIYFKIIEVVGKGILLKPTTSVPFELSTLRDKIFLPIHYLLS